MAKSQINVTRVVKTIVSEQSNNVAVSFVDGSGIERVMNLSPHAQDSLLEALVARPPLNADAAARIGQQHLKAHDAWLYAAPMPDAVGLELSLGPTKALHVLLPDAVAKAIAELLRTHCEAVTGKVSAH
jgi:hypothetical protein